jgi:hypothetical protein
LFQLPPVVAGKDEKLYISSNYETEYFFSSIAYQILNPQVIELTKVYRQQDEKFVKILNKIRIGIFEKQDLDILNKRLIDKRQSFDDNVIILTTTNKSAEDINTKQLKKLK